MAIDYNVASPEDALLEKAATRPFFGRMAIYARLSGPGWLQGAITLGGGSLAGSLFIGILAGPHLLWIQAFAMMCGITMLSAIAYVTLSTGQKPMETVSRHLTPVLAIAWAVATVIANVVFALPQFALATATILQNLMPGMAASTVAPWVIGGGLAVSSVLIVWGYESGSRGIRIFEAVLKVLVGVVVLSFFVVVAMLIARGQIDISSIIGGFIPHFRQLHEPTLQLGEVAAATGAHESIWRTIISAQQRDVIIAAGGTAVGINMTFLLPYTLLRRGWKKKHRELSICDLSLGLFIPFIIATSCLVLAAGSAFYTKTNDVFDENGAVRPAMARAFTASMDGFLAQRDGAAFTAASPEEQAGTRALLSPEDRRMAAMLAKRDAGQLSAALAPVLGKGGANLVFGVGVVAMAWSSIIILILMNGIAIGALLKKDENRTVFRVGTAMPAISGFLAPVVWTGASRAALAIPASVIATTLLPIAYFTFLLLMNSKGALGENRPRGAFRFVSNVLMVGATSAAGLASIWALTNRGTAGMWGLVGLALLFVIGIAGFIRNRHPR
ncbi:divalent metal cation transporter [Synoicihabitans lomoniglobus]|uniref:Divalent metal cation transporter n=1 Tax=Synoicihabitans lomoniglobus TaxID=2909285 RepID=A0AAF0I3A0_9BACT|nr:divalent metal cation transporter [Opitutaceae bacterium LMO-M01]WED67002.1 divalent metal cation transporter [Opitutaceae bacterium LMO-M01]